ncbi:MAG: aromatic ring-hydroxylating dioxygenase subunit alpha [Acidimicrobiia bacterium]
MKVPFTWKPTGWFMIGWSAEYQPGTVKPLKYFGKDLVAYRDDDGDLHVLDAHCPHLGAHLGHRGRVNGSCVECPYHGWGFGPDGVNKYIPYEDRPNVSKSLKAWPVKEQHECIYVWHDPAGGAPRWDLPSVFDAHPDLPGNPDDFYRAYPEMSVKYDREPVHPQIPLENAPDSMHFKYVHHATVDPVLLEYGTDGNVFKGTVGWPDAKDPSGEKMALKIHAMNNGVGNTLNVFEGAANYRLIFCVTPVDDETSDMFYSIWWPRGSDTSKTVPAEIRREVERKFLITLYDDLEIWRYQIYVEHPALAQIDAKPYGALRKWARQFYEVEPVG